MLEDEFKTLLHRIALALGIAQSHPDPAAYADEVINAHDSINAKVKTPDPVAGAPVLTDATEWPVPQESTQTAAQYALGNGDQIHADPAPAPVDTTVGSVIDPAAPVEVKEDAGNVPAVDTSYVLDAATTSTDIATISSEQPAHADGESPAIQGE